MKYGIEFRHLAYFVCVAEELHFSRAADRLGMAQAPLSQQIKQLEDRLGTKLFQRTTRRVKLTPAGEIFLQHALEILGGIDRAVTQTRSTGDENSGSIVVSGVHIAMSHVIPPIIATFRKKYPRVTVDVLPVGTADQLELLLSGEVHVSFTRLTNPTRSIRMEHLLTEGLVAVLPKEHRLAHKPDLNIKDFAGEPIIAYAPTVGASYNRVVMDAFRRAKLYPMIVQEVSHTLSISTLVAAGIGLGIAPSWVRHTVSPYLSYRSLEELPAAVDLVVAWRSEELSQIVLDFVETARSIAPTVKW